jgi:hypothetical protein
MHWTDAVLFGVYIYYSWQCECVFIVLPVLPAVIGPTPEFLGKMSLREKNMSENQERKKN